MLRVAIESLQLYRIPTIESQPALQPAAPVRLARRGGSLRQSSGIRHARVRTALVFAVLQEVHVDARCVPRARTEAHQQARSLVPVTARIASTSAAAAPNNGEMQRHAAQQEGPTQPSRRWTRVALPAAAASGPPGSAPTASGQPAGTVPPGMLPARGHWQARAAGSSELQALVLRSTAEHRHPGRRPL